MALSFVLEVPGTGQRTANSGLSAGDYWANGNVSLAPLPGNYTSSSVLSDGVPGDTSTRETASSDTFTIIRVNASAISIASWAVECKYRGALTPNWFYWDGSNWQSMSDTNGTPWTVNIAYQDVGRTATFSGVPSATVWRFTWTESIVASGNASMSDSRVA